MIKYIIDIILTKPPKIPFTYSNFIFSEINNIFLSLSNVLLSSKKRSNIKIKKINNIKNLNNKIYIILW